MATARFYITHSSVCEHLRTFALGAQQSVVGNGKHVGAVKICKTVVV